MGCYPLLVCRDWSRLCEDVAALGDRLVSLTAVTDPYAEEEMGSIRACFDHVERFEEHQVVDLMSLPGHERTSKHHRYYAKCL